MASLFSTLQFTGGMNDWVHPGLLPSNFAAKLINAEVSSGKIVPIKKPVLLANNNPVFYGHYGTRDRSVVKWYDRNYWSNNTAIVSGFYGGDVENYIGIPYPAYSGASANVSIADSTPGEGETGLTGDFKYCVCFVNANGWEGAPGSLTEYEMSYSLTDGFASITVTWSDARVHHAKIYRTIDKGADFYHVGDVTTSGASFTDKTTDTMLQLMNPLTTINNYPPPDRGKYLCEYDGVFFLAVDSNLYFSAQSNPHAWPTLQFISFDDTITGIVPEFQGILVFTANNIFRVVGANSSETITKTYIPGNHGCINFRSISVLNNAPIWYSNDGICLWDGSSVTVNSYQVLKTDNLVVEYAVSANDCYFLFHSSGCIVLDQKNGGIFYELDFSCDYSWYDGTTGIMYLLAGNALYRYGYGTNLKAIYQSPNIGGAESIIKVFRELILNSDGSCAISVFVDGSQIAVLYLSGGRQRVKLPMNAIGKYLLLQVESSDDINELAVIYD